MRRNYFLYVRIKTEDMRGFPILLPLFPLLECIDAFHDFLSFFSFFIPALRKDTEGSTVYVIKYGLKAIMQMLDELYRCDVKELVEVNVPKDNVSVIIRLL